MRLVAQTGTLLNEHGLINGAALCVRSVCPGMT